MRYDRKYELIIGVGNLAVSIRNPMRIVFDCAKSIVGGRNKINLKVYNLLEYHRNSIVKDAEGIEVIPVQLRVGYGDSLETIFKGNIHTGSNDRSGADIISTISCLDGGYDTINSYTSKVVKGKAASLNAAIGDMPNTDIGKITSLSPISRPKVMVGSTSDIIDTMIAPGESWYIDNEQLFIVKGDEVVSRYIPVVSARTGLLNTPQRQNQKVTIETLLNPTIKLGTNIELKSANAPHLNAIYKVESMTYNGDTDGADWRQTLTCIVNLNYRVI